MSKEAKVEPKPVEAKAEKVEPKPPPMRRWGGIEYPEDSFVRVTFLATGGVNGMPFVKGKSGDVPKAVFESTLKPNRQAKLWAAPKPAMAMARPKSDQGGFRRHR